MKIIQNPRGFKKGHIPWNKGLTKKSDPRIKDYASKVSLTLKQLNGIKSRFQLGHPFIPHKAGCQCAKCTGISPTLGRTRSTETRKKIGLGNSVSLKGRHISPKTEFTSERMKGSKNYRWRGGITPENIKIRNSIQSRLWRKSVFGRDYYTCQKYKIKGIKLAAHHIKNFPEYPELRFAIDNGITLSEKAHIEFHKKYGRKNNTKEQIEEFLSN